MLAGSDLYPVSFFFLQGDVATVYRAACIAKLAKLAALSGPVPALSPAPEVASYVNSAHAKLVMLQVQVG